MSKTVLIHFCGTDTTTQEMSAQFVSKVNADMHIYFNGPGASRSFIDRILTKCPGANNSYFTMADEGSTKVITVEKKWKMASSMNGISADDSEKTQKYMQYIFENLEQFGLDKADVFDEESVFVIAGHSRGAAACLPSWVGTLAPNMLPNAHLVLLDPVAGQTGNSYNIGNSWTTFATAADTNPILYSVFKAATSGTCTVTEIWAKAAKSAAVMQGLFFDKLKSYNPARKYLVPADPALEVSFKRVGLGFSHSAMVGLDARYDDYYDGDIQKPSQQVIGFLQNLFAAGENEYQFNDIDYETLLDVSNNSGDLEDRYADRWLATFENQIGEQVEFQDFVNATNDV